MWFISYSTVYTFLQDSLFAKHVYVLFQGIGVALYVVGVFLYIYDVYLHYLSSVVKNMLSQKRKRSLA